MGVAQCIIVAAGPLADADKITRGKQFEMLADNDEREIAHWLGRQRLQLQCQHSCALRARRRSARMFCGCISAICSSSGSISSSGGRISASSFQGLRGSRRRRAPSISTRTSIRSRSGSSSDQAARSGGRRARSPPPGCPDSRCPRRRCYCRCWRSCRRRASPRRHLRCGDLGVSADVSWVSPASVASRESSYRFRLHRPQQVRCRYRLRHGYRHHRPRPGCCHSILVFALEQRIFRGISPAPD